MSNSQAVTDVAELQRRVAELEQQLAKALQERDEYKEIVQRAPAFISRLTPDGRVKYVNTTCEEIIGYRLDEVMDQNLLPVLYPGELIKPVLEYLRLTAEGKDVRTHEVTLRSRNGELRKLAWSSFQRFGPDGEVLEIISLGIDVTEWKKAEAQRQRLQEEIIAMQASALIELSTPLIPISDETVVMPLIGSIDEARARQILETLLAGISKTRASTAILDITGVTTIDTRGADVLLQVTRAARMLGAQVVVTGIRPEVAQTLVSLGANLEGIVTRATLQSGIAFALGRG